MVVPIGDNVLSNPVHCYSSETVELPVAGSVGAELVKELSVAVEHLDAVVARVCDHHRVVWTDGYASWPCEVSGLAPPTSYLIQLTTLLQVLTPGGMN